MEPEIGPGAGEPYPPQAWPAQGQPPVNPYGYPGYPPYGYGAPQRPSGTNGMAIASLVLGICGFFFITPIVGLVLGLVALSAVRKSGQRGKGLAISGIVTSGAWIAVFATIITIAVLNTPDPPQRDADGNVIGKGAVSVFALRPKDCFTVPAGLIGSTDGKTRTFTVVPCSTPHDSEAIGSFTAAENSFPGVDAIRAESTSQCIKVLSTYLPDTGSLPTGTRVEFVFPNKQSWGVTGHKVTCFLQFPGASMTRLVYRDASSYTADQLRFLNAVHPLIEAVSQLNSTPKTGPLDLRRQRAGDVARAMQDEVSALTAAPWPADVQPAVDAVVAKHRDAAQYWAQAAGADDLTAFDDALGKADRDFDPLDMKAIRTALNLPTTPSSTSSTSQAA